jgi:hypothetical protein
VDAYVLGHQAAEHVIDRLYEVPEVRFASRTVGAHLAVAVVSGEEISDVVSVVERVHRWGVVAHETAIPLLPNPSQSQGALPRPPYIKGMTPLLYEAFVGLTVGSPLDHFRHVVAELRRLDVTIAVHIVAGRYQIMAELGSLDYPPLREALLYEVPSIEGITSITSSLAICYNAPEGVPPPPGTADWFWRDPDPEKPVLWGTARQVEA